MTTTKLPPKYVKDMFGQFLSVAVKKDGMTHNVFLTGIRGCSKLTGLTEILKERNFDFKIFDASNLETKFQEAVDAKEIVIIDELISKELNIDAKLSSKLKEIMDIKKIIIVCHSTDDERDYGWNYKSIVDSCLIFHYPQI